MRRAHQDNGGYSHWCAQRTLQQPLRGLGDAVAHQAIVTALEQGIGIVLLQAGELLGQLLAERFRCRSRSTMGATQRLSDHLIDDAQILQTLSGCLLYTSDAADE